MRIIPNRGACDPHVHIFGGRAWLFSTHDRGPGNSLFRMDDWRTPPPMIPPSLSTTTGEDPLHHLGLYLLP